MEVLGKFCQEVEPRDQLLIRGDKCCWFAKVPVTLGCMHVCCSMCVTCLTLEQFYCMQVEYICV